MRVLSVVSDDRFNRLRAQLGAGRCLPTAASCAEAAAALRAARCDVLIIDPSHVRADTYMSVIRLAASTGTRVVLYCPRDYIGLRRAIDAANVMPVELIVQDGDGETGALRRALDCIGEPSLPALMLVELATTICHMRPPLATTVAALLGGCSVPQTVSDFLGGFDEHPRTVQSWITRAAISSPSDLLWGIRIGRLYDCLTERQATLERVADEYGVSARTLTSKWSRLTGFPPRTAVRELDRHEMSRRLVQSMTVGDQASRPATRASRREAAETAQLLPSAP